MLLECTLPASNRYGLGKAAGLVLIAAVEGDDQAVAQAIGIGVRKLLGFGRGGAVRAAPQRADMRPVDPRVQGAMPSSSVA